MIIKKKQYNIVALLIKNKAKFKVFHYNTERTLAVQYLMEFLRPINVIRPDK